MAAACLLRKGEHQRNCALQVVKVVVRNDIEKSFFGIIPAQGHAFEIVGHKRRRKFRQLFSSDDRAWGEVQNTGGVLKPVTGEHSSGLGQHPGR